MFYGDSVVQTYVFLYLAARWNSVMSFWLKKEKPFLSHPYTVRGMGLPRKIILIGVVFFVSYLMEHLMFTVMMANFNQYQMETCNITSISHLNNYMRRERPHLLDVLPYRWWLFPIFQWTITLLVFSWNFVDFFIIMLSLGLSTRFDQLNERLRQTPSYLKDRKFWLEIRLHFTGLVELVEFIDKRISLLILLSMSHNLFLVCTKIFEAVK